MAAVAAQAAAKVVSWEEPPAGGRREHRAKGAAEGPQGGGLGGVMRRLDEPLEEPEDPPLQKANARERGRQPDPGPRGAARLSKTAAAAPPRSLLRGRGARFSLPAEALVQEPVVVLLLLRVALVDRVASAARRGMGLGVGLLG